MSRGYEYDAKTATGARKYSWKHELEENSRASEYLSAGELRGRTWLAVDGNIKHSQFPPLTSLWYLHPSEFSSSLAVNKFQFEQRISSFRRANRPMVHISLFFVGNWVNHIIYFWCPERIQLILCMYLQISSEYCALKLRIRFLSINFLYVP